ncbi:hypothetical protein F66182_17355, partial [Fusarium sp. NRRL 66182]
AKNIEGEYSDDTSSRYSQEEGSDVPSINNSAAELADRPAKRRRVSVSSNDSEDSNTENYTPIAPLPTISRIKKKGDVSSVSNIPSAEEPVSSRDARDIGLQVTDSTFSTLNVAPWLVKSLSTLAIRRPTGIQKSCIPEILQGKDCIGGSRTGSGKTIAFAVPILQKWAEDPFGVYAVVLTPTRELALQIFEQFKAISAPQSLKPVLITGGTDMRPQAIALSQRPHVIIATPGRLADHIRTSGEDTIVGLNRVRMVVMDEADRLLTSGQGSMLPDVETCLSALPPSSERQTLLFTATVTPEVRALKSMPRPANRPPIHVTEIGTENHAPIPPTLNQTYLQV